MQVRRHLGDPPPGQACVVMSVCWGGARLARRSEAWQCPPCLLCHSPHHLLLRSDPASGLFWLPRSVSSARPCFCKFPRSLSALLLRGAPRRPRPQSAGLPHIQCQPWEPPGSPSQKPSLTPGDSHPSTATCQDHDPKLTRAPVPPGCLLTLPGTCPYLGSFQDCRAILHLGHLPWAGRSHCPFS